MKMSDTLHAPRQDMATETPPDSVQSAPRQRWAFLLQILLLTGLFSLLIYGWAWWVTGSPSLVGPYLQGRRLLFDPAEIVIQDAEPGATIVRKVHVLNLTGNRATLLGSLPSCRCLTLDEFPIEIEPGQSRDLSIRTRIPSKPGEFAHTIRLFSNTGNTEAYLLAVRGNVK